jgi:hypothetical protein
MSRIRSRAATAALVAAIAIIPTVAGCGQAAEQVAEQAAEQAIGGDVQLDDGNVTVTDDEGNEVAIGEDVSLPDTWPAEVPVYEDGTLAMVSTQADGAAFATWMTDATPEEAATSYDAALTAAGFTLETDSNMGGMVVREYVGNGYTVGVSVIESDSQASVMVTATKDA